MQSCTVALSKTLLCVCEPGTRASCIYIYYNIYIYITSQPASQRRAHQGGTRAAPGRDQGGTRAGPGRDQGGTRASSSSSSCSSSSSSSSSFLLRLFRCSSLFSSPTPLLYPNPPKKDMNINNFFQHCFFVIFCRSKCSLV